MSCFLLLFVSISAAKTAQDINIAFLSDHVLSNAPAMSRWHETSCKHFYIEPGDLFPFVRPQPRLSVEDLHKGGRNYGVMQHIPAQELYISHKYKVAYIAVRKSGSTVINEVMKEMFDSSLSWCRAQCRRTPICYFAGRCTTMALNREQLQKYFFFSFVRHPVSRWFSQYAQAHVIFETEILDEVSKSHALATLQKFSRQHFAIEHHLQSQVHSLSSLIFDGTSVPLHFIGKMENFDSDWKIVLREIERRNGLAMGTLDRNETLPLVTHHEGLRDLYVERIKQFRRDPDIIRAIVEAYTQDFWCFGYSNTSDS